MDMHYKTFFGSVDVTVDMDLKMAHANGNLVSCTADLPGQKHFPGHIYFALTLLVLSVIQFILAPHVMGGTAVALGYSLSAIVFTLALAFIRMWHVTRGRRTVKKRLEFIAQNNWHPYTAMTRSELLALLDSMELSLEISGNKMAVHEIMLLRMDDRVTDANLAKACITLQSLESKG